MIAPLTHVLLAAEQTSMGQLLVRNVDDDLIRRLKERAATHGRSAEAEHRAILTRVLRPRGESFRERAARWRELTAGRPATDSADLIRSDRDREEKAAGQPSLADRIRLLGVD
jgi:antitoxin FitA